MTDKVGDSNIDDIYVLLEKTWVLESGRTQI